MSPRAHPLPVASPPLAVPEVSLDVDCSRSGRVKSKGKEKVTRADPSPASSWKMSRRDGAWAVSARGQTARLILSLLIEEEKDSFSYPTPKPPAAPAWP